MGSRAAGSPAGQLEEPRGSWKMAGAALGGRGGGGVGGRGAGLGQAGQAGRTFQSQKPRRAMGLPEWWLGRTGGGHQ